MNYRTKSRLWLAISGLFFVYTLGPILAGYISFMGLLCLGINSYCFWQNLKSGQWR